MTMNLWELVGMTSLSTGGQVVHIKYKVPADFTESVALFEVNHPDLRLDQLDIGDGLVEVHHIQRPYVEIPVCNYTQHNITLGNFTVLGSIQPIDKIVETDQLDCIEVQNVNSLVPVGEDEEDNGRTEQRSQLWHPPVHVSQLTMNNKQ